jgi:Leucine-rich repeat (LRR) protein
MGSSFNQPDAGNYYESGLNSLNSQDYMKAIGDFTNAIALNGKNGDAYYQRAYAKELLGNKMGFFSTDLCGDLVMAMVNGKKEASKKLNELCLGECYDLDGAFIDPESVYCADFSSKVLTDLPADMDRLAYVVKLNLFNNKVPTLSAKWAAMDQLISLDLSSNRLSLIPSVIGKLTHLEELNLNKNLIPTLPIEISHMKKLKKLTMRQNALTSLPNEFCDLEQLESLDLAMNTLVALPANIGNLKNLKHLTLVGNEIPAKEQQRIKAALPNTQIVFE